MHPYQSILASLLLLVATTEATTPLEYISPFQLCQRLHANQTGFYCHPLFPRGYLHCPSGVEDVCPPTTLCVDTRAGDVPVVVVTTVVNTTVTEINTVMTTFDNETVAVDGDGAVDTNDTTPVDSSDTSNEDTVDTSLTSSSSPPSIQCLPDPNDRIVEQCKNALPNTSRCLDDHTVVECDVREALPCPSDMKCQRRGGRAYCVQPRFITPEGESDATGDGELDVCKGYQETVNQMVNSSTPYPPELSVCHPWNLKKKIDCPSGRVQICPNGHMCDVGDQKVEWGMIV